MTPMTIRVVSMSVSSPGRGAAAAEYHRIRRRCEVKSAQPRWPSSSGLTRGSDAGADCASETALEPRSICRPRAPDGLILGSSPRMTGQGKSPELPQPPGALPPGPGAFAEPVSPGGPLAAAAAAIDPFGARLGAEGGDVGEAALLVGLQLDALAAAHLGQVGDGEDQRLDVVDDGRDAVAGDAEGGAHLAVEHLFAAALLGQQVVFR